MTATRQQWEQARAAGVSARQNGKKRDQSPLYAMGRDGETLREAWQMGWDDEDARRAKR
ncbi:hypothetical protein [Novilysobacter erysipheiresistens]|uniref:Ribosome modulation factor n=1 Tax=Novilysobacter erysipheiresistens TaxID=1749332 RepID=A0ABU7YUN7_9GAMM